MVWLQWATHRQQEMYNLTVDTAHTFFVGDGQWLVHNCGGKVSSWPDAIADQTKTFEKNMTGAKPAGDFSTACTVCAAQTGLDPKYAGQPRAILYFPEKGHAVLGLGADKSTMMVIDNSRWSAVYGTNIPLVEYIRKYGQPQLYDALDDAINAVLDAQ